MPHIAYLAAVRTSLSQRLHSLPPSHRCTYLEGHMLSKHKDRLQKEIAVLQRRCEHCRERLADVEAQMQALAGREMAAQGRALASADERSAPSRLARMSIEY